MGERVHAVNGAVLEWARERAGLTVEEVGAAVGRRADDILDWESGNAWPTFSQLEDLAERVYRRPVAVFFFPEPPEEPSAAEEFRTLPDFEIGNLTADTRYTIRVGRAYQDSLRELSGGLNPSPRLIFRELRPHPSDDPAVTALQIREYLGVSIEEQMSLRGSETATARWRAAIESVGVYVFKKSFSQREVSGFCLSDQSFPIIFVNNSTSFNRQTFTLFHELAHLLFGVNSITAEDTDFVNDMPASARDIEVVCNRIASELLLPSSAFPWDEFRAEDVDRSADAIARRFNVSRELVLRRALDAGLVSQQMYVDKAAEWAEDARRATTGRGGGDYYATQAAYLGRSFLELAFSRYRAGLIDVGELSQHLGVKARFIDKLETRLYGGR